jgi:DNA-binding response OmpR family regulator
LKKARIAIIEDEAIIAKDIEIILEKAGYEISGVF